MKKIYILTIIILFLSCSKNRSKLNSENKLIDSCTFYLNEFNNNSLKNKIILNDKAFKIILLKKNSIGKRENLDKLINNYYEIGEWESYFSATKVLLSESKNENDLINLAKANRYKGNYYYNIQILDSAFYYYFNSEKLYLKTKDYENYAIVLLKKGNVQLDIKDFFGAEISLKKAYNILKKTKDYQRLFANINSLGIVSIEFRDYEKAISNYKNALAIVKKANLETKEHQEAICLNNIGTVYNEQKNYKKAIYYFKKSLLDKSIKNDNLELYSSIIDNLAYSKLKSNNFNNLPNQFLESLKIREKLNILTSRILSYNHLSEYYSLVNDSSRAILYSENAIKTAKESKNADNLILALKQASNIDKKNASKYTNEFIKLTDSLQIVERKNIDRFTRIQLETDEIIQEKDQLVEKNRNILNYFMGAIIIGGFLFFVRIQRSRSRELVLKQSQQQANEEIYRLIISHQNQLEEGRDLEKRRISKELHDGVLGRLFGLRLNLDGLNNYDDQDAKQQRLDYLNELKVIEQDLREISHELNRENLVLINNFVAIINNLLEQQAKINPAKVKSIIAEDIDWDKLPNTAKINLYRILQEALQNINKYAEAKTILIHFRKDKKGNLLFNIEDDGVGYDMNSKKSKGIGMKNIVARTQQCQGIIDIKSEIGKGSKIIITFPLENKTIKV